MRCRFIVAEDGRLRTIQHDSRGACSVRARHLDSDNGPGPLLSALPETEPAAPEFHGREPYGNHNYGGDIAFHTRRSVFGVAGMSVCPAGAPAQAQ